MKTTLKRQACVFIILSITTITGCTKTEPIQSTTSIDNYSSTANFFQANQPEAQRYIVNGVTGGVILTPKGTRININPNSFMNNSGQIISGPVTITFKDIYKKSDMLLNDMPTYTNADLPLKSAGEFFIKATYNGEALSLIKPMSVIQPMNGSTIDRNMKPFIMSKNFLFDEFNGWVSGSDSNMSVNFNIDSSSFALSDYVFSLYQFTDSIGSGVWCNSDNASFFSMYPQTILTLQQSDNPLDYGTYVFLVFKDINTMIHVYNYNGSFPYSYAPLGLQCTVVAVGIKNGTVYSSFTLITISANPTVNFSMTATTTAAFKAALTALN